MSEIFARKKKLQYSTKKKGAKSHKQCILAFQGGK